MTRDKKSDSKTKGRLSDPPNHGDWRKNLASEPEGGMSLKSLSPADFLVQAQRLIQFELTHKSNTDADREPKKISSLVNLALDGVFEDPHESLDHDSVDEGSKSSLIKFPQKLGRDR